MKRLLPLFILFVGGCTSPHKTQNRDAASVLTIDVSQSYPQQTVDVHKIADIRYIPLDLVDGSPFTGSSLFNFKISDEYMITHDLSTGDIILFDSLGKLIRTFNHLGDGPRQYYYFTQMVADFKQEELFVADYKKKEILVYSFTGDFLRTLPLHFLGDKGALTALHDYNAEYLIIRYDSLHLSKELGNTKYPYRLISKENGAMQKINLPVNKPLTPALYCDTLFLDGKKKIETVRGNQLFDLKQLMKNGDEILIADQGLDTVYCFKDEKLTPLFNRTPLMRTMNSPVIINPRLFTDDYFYFSLLDAVPPSDPYINYKTIGEYVLNRKNGEISAWRMADANQDAQRKLLPPMGDMNLSFETKNRGFFFLSADKLVDDYKADKLQGELKEIASRLTPDSNVVLMIYQFK